MSYDEKAPILDRFCSDLVYEVGSVSGALQAMLPSERLAMALEIVGRRRLPWWRRWLRRDGL